MKTILVTGFEPFGKDTVNPSWEAVKQIKDIEGAKIIKACLPVTYRGAAEELIDLIKKEQPNGVLCVGQAGGRKDITVEQVAINLMSAEITDNDGVMMREVPIDTLGPDGLFSNLNVMKIVQAVKDAGVPASRSLSAGSFICNKVLYSAINWAYKNKKKIRCGFVHVPFLPEQVKDKENVPSMTLEDMVRGLNAAAEEVYWEL